MSFFPTTLLLMKYQVNTSDIPAHTLCTVSHYNPRWVLCNPYDILISPCLLYSYIMFISPLCHCSVMFHYILYPNILKYICITHIYICNAHIYIYVTHIYIYNHHIYIYNCVFIYIISLYPIRYPHGFLLESHPIPSCDALETPRPCIAWIWFSSSPSTQASCDRFGSDQKNMGKNIGNWLVVYQYIIVYYSWCMIL